MGAGERIRKIMINSTLDQTFFPIGGQVLEREFAFYCDNNNLYDFGNLLFRWIFMTRCSMFNVQRYNSPEGIHSGDKHSEHDECFFQNKFIPQTGKWKNVKIEDLT